jgi:hypothetical protein
MLFLHAFNENPLAAINCRITPCSHVVCSLATFSRVERLLLLRCQLWGLPRYEEAGHEFQHLSSVSVGKNPSCNCCYLTLPRSPVTRVWHLVAVCFLGAYLVFCDFISVILPNLYTYDFVVLTSLTHPRKILLVGLQIGKGPPLWSSGQSFWLQTQRSRVRFPALPDFLRSRGVCNGVHSAS